jgi:hypothetical protein
MRVAVVCREERMIESILEKIDQGTIVRSYGPTSALGNVLGFVFGATPLLGLRVIERGEIQEQRIQINRQSSPASLQLNLKDIELR